MGHDLDADAAVVRSGKRQDRARLVCVRPSGTEDVYKLYAESLLGRRHLARILAEATSIVQRALTSAAARPPE